ncbi:MAG: helix-turn-helix domain-containing protein [Longimicrobiales bacterium]
MVETGLVNAGNGGLSVGSETKELEAVRQRIDIVLAHVNGASVSETADAVGVSRPTARKWIRRHEAAGLPGLLSEKPPGREAEIPDVIRDEMVRLPQESRPPMDLGETGDMGRGDQWTARLLAEAFDVSPAYVSAAWAEADFDPPLHLQQVMANPDRSVSVELELTAPAWLKLHWQLCRRESDPAALQRAHVAMVAGPDVRDALRREVFGTLRRRWTDLNETLPRIDPRSIEYRHGLRERGHDEG